MLPPAAGPTTGVVGESGSTPVRVAVLGESTAAGCGARTHDDGFAGALARELATHTGRAVTWMALGQPAATLRRIRYRLLPQVGPDLSVAVLLAGVNDVLTRRPPEQWGEDLAAVVDALAERAERVAVAGLPPFAAFPSLPSTLGRYLTERADALDAVSRQVCAPRQQTVWVSSSHIRPLTDDFFAADRFHPGKHGYERRARVVAERLTGW
jgi:lysophospholipase L1-like esterase